MKKNQAFIAHHCDNESAHIEQSLKGKNYSITKKNCSGVRALRYINREKPTICVLKANYEDLSGFDIIKQARLKKSKTKFILVFNTLQEIDVVIAKQFNVSGCLSCDDTIEEVKVCVEKIHNNEDYFSKELLEEIDREQIENYSNFTDFQLKILAYVGFYHNPDKLANKLNVAMSTVNQEIALINSQLRLPSDQPLHQWAANNTTFIENLVLSEVS
jgi:DNA-binding NarL/FixJ family response regulator